jgi:peptidoglycan/LPS O-acetylase OafA/YrhL
VPTHHDERLQSLRGLAALLVIVGHGLIVVPQPLFMFLIGGIFEQDASVVFFYVLSGFVLGQSLSRDPRFYPFVVRRLARLLPVLWASLAVAIVISMIVAGRPTDGATDWYNVYRSVDTSPHAIIMNAVALSWRINSVMWSVQIELFVIPLLPLGVLAVQRFVPLQALTVLIGLCIAGVLLLNHFDARPVAYLYCFYIGMLIPNAARAQILQPFFTPTMVLVGLGITFELHEIGLYPPAKHIIDALVSAQLITFVLRSPTAATFLRHPWLVLMGDVSYSLYAFGQITLIFVAFTMFTILPANSWTYHPMAFAVCLIGLNIALALPIAVASYRWIELPGMALAKLILNRRAAPSTT